MADIRFDVWMGPVPGHETLAGAFTVNDAEGDFYRNAMFQFGKKLQAMLKKKEGHAEPEDDFRVGGEN